MTALAYRTRGRVPARIRRSADAGPIEFLASSGAVASDGMVIRPSAWRESVQRFKAGKYRPKFLAAHASVLPDGSAPTIGRIVEMDESDEGLMVAVEFAPATVTARGPEYEAAYRGAFMDSVSVGWDAARFAPENTWKDRGIPEIEYAELLEVSAVAIPADALAKMRARAADPLASLARSLEKLNDGLKLAKVERNCREYMAKLLGPIMPARPADPAAKLLANLRELNAAVGALR